MNVTRQDVWKFKILILLFVLNKCTDVFATSSWYSSSGDVQLKVSFTHYIIRTKE